MEHIKPHQYLLEEEETYEPPEDPDSGRSPYLLSLNNLDTTPSLLTRRTRYACLRTAPERPCH